MHSERPKLHRVLAILSAKGLKKEFSPLRTKSNKVFSLRVDPILERLQFAESKQEVTKVIPLCTGCISAKHESASVHPKNKIFVDVERLKLF